MDVLEEDVLEVTNKRSNKKRRKRYIIAILVLIIVNVSLAYGIGLKIVGLSALHWRAQAFYILITHFFFVPLGILVFLIGLLAALFSEKGTYKARVFSFFRVAFFVVLVLNFLLLIFFGIRKYSMSESDNPFIAKDYETVDFCFDETYDLKVGTFYGYGYTFERDAEYQYEINSSTGESIRYKINWLSDCEYILTSDDKNANYGVNKIWVKIVENNEEFYSFYVSWDGKEAIFDKLYKSPL